MYQAMRGLESRYIPAAIIVCGLAIACYWVFLVPIFQAPDEDIHAEYVFYFYTKDNLMRNKEIPINGLSHPLCLYLLDATNGENVKHHSFVKMSPDYGTKEFFAKLDKNVPPLSWYAQVHGNPVMMASYPIGYYALTAMWLRLISCFSHSITVLFYSARMLSVILLGISLVLSWLTMKELKLSPWKSSLILAAIAMLPLVSFIGSYIQSDNLSLTLTSLCFFLSLNWRKSTRSRTMYALSLAMAALLLTKYQFFCCTGTAVLALVISKAIYSKYPLGKLIKILTVLLFPALIAGTFQGWMSWNCNLRPIDFNHRHWFPVFTQFFNELHKSVPSLFLHILNALMYQYKMNYTINGDSFSSFWGLFGWLDTPLVFGSPQITETVKICLVDATNIIILLTLASLLKITLRLCRLVKKGRWRSAVLIAGANPVLNSYFLFVLFTFAFSVFTYPSFTGQGRHWFPYILPIVLGATCYAPQAFRSYKVRQKLFLFIAGAWLIYSIAGSYFASISLNNRYYIQQYEPLEINKLRPSTKHALCGLSSLRYIDRYPSFNRHKTNSLCSLTVPKGRNICIEGWATDFPNDSLAYAVLLLVDHNKIYQAAYGSTSVEAINATGDKKYRFSGFGCLIPTADLEPGKHSISIKVVGKDKVSLYDGDIEIYVFVK